MDSAGSPAAPRTGHRAQGLTAIIQLLLVVLGSAATLAPPAEGFMIVMPAIPGNSAATERWSASAGAQMIAAGPYAGSIVVHGSRAALLLPALSHGALLVTARFTGCGTKNLEGR
ncbi:hypothetical protein QH494_14880 [Sphingomonas sp. AR_OL41]|uniref:hypothetical protein n=1 Tax=Sphingomonas sp. AR_OL41 TaxID=3042729 RepID=UPI002480882E|nr:hypothetical protein [Sphingomonas sp. AR_OL41]MDH7973473.1 hypothetical protein [Sphingomonas sp. AR_OL41]